MKKIIVLSAFIFATVFFASCSGPEGPAGDNGNANVWSVSYIIYPSDWVADGFGKWYDRRTTPIIDKYIMDFGAVLFYLKSTNGNNTWTQLPSTAVYHDQVGNTYSEEYVPWYGVGMLEIQFYDTHPTTPLKPDWNCVIKVVVIDGNPAAMKKLKEVDTDNYEQVKATFNLD